MKQQGQADVFFWKTESLSKLLEENSTLFDRIFERDGMMRKRSFCNRSNAEVQFTLFFSDGLTDGALIGEQIIRPLIFAEGISLNESLLEQLQQQMLFASEVKESDDIAELIEAVCYGDSILFAQGSDKALIISTKQFTLRAPTEPENERVLMGPREGFSEGIMANLAMIRRRLRTNDFKMEFQSIGTESKTSICICYIDSVVNHNILKELKRRLKQVELDGILDSNYLVEYIAERSYCGYATVGATERPDVAVARMLEGRITLLVDGTPMALTVPFLLIENFQSNEDYYMHPLHASFYRILRIIASFFSITLPGLLVAAMSYHHELIDSTILLNFALVRKNIPYPAAVECLIMLFVFMVLQETGLRMPGQVGQAMSIVGSLVIGQAAVEANLVSSPMLIVVAFTGITEMLVPQLNTPHNFFRLSMLFVGAMFGLAGVLMVLSLMLLHLFSLESFGVPYFTPLDRVNEQAVKDTFVRTSWANMKTRISPLASRIRRMSSRGGKS